MTPRYREHLQHLAESGDKHAIEALRREGIEIDAESVEPELPSGYDQSIPRKPLDEYRNRQVLPDWQNFKR